MYCPLLQSADRKEAEQESLRASARAASVTKSAVDEMSNDDIRAALREDTFGEAFGERES